MGFAPMNDPKIAICVYVENGGWGADYGVPIGGLMMAQYLHGKLSPASEAQAAEMQKRRIGYGQRFANQPVKGKKGSKAAAKAAADSAAAAKKAAALAAAKKAAALAAAKQKAELKAKQQADLKAKQKGKKGAKDKNNEAQRGKGIVPITIENHQGRR